VPIEHASPTVSWVIYLVVAVLSGGVGGGLVHLIGAWLERRRVLDDQDRREGTGKKLQDIGILFDRVVYYLRRLRDLEYGKSDPRPMLGNADRLVGTSQAVGMPAEFTQAAVALRDAVKTICDLSAEIWERERTESTFQSEWKRLRDQEPCRTLSAFASRLHAALRTVYEVEERRLRYHRRLTSQVRRSEKDALSEIASALEQLKRALQQATEPGA
jgi:hypothetical protein